MMLLEIRKENLHRRNLLHLSTVVASKNNSRAWVKIQSARWVNIQSANTDNHFQAIPASTFVLESYLHYLYHIGKDSLPNAFVLITEKFGDSLSTSVSSDGNIRWYLDALLDRVMYEDLKKLKATPRLRIATMCILDALVQAGSSVAFQLRDDFVTPNSNVAASAS